MLKNKWIKKIIYGFAFLLINTALFSIGSSLFITSVIPYVYEPAIDDWVAKSGNTHYRRSEGWATTHYGKYGVPAIGDISKLKGNVVAFWGDSFVAGFHVDDDQKMAQVFTRLSRKQGLEHVTAIGIGRAGANFADYYYKFPKYENLTPIKVHVIIIAQVSDLLPLENGILGRFVSEPEFSLQKSTWSLSPLKVSIAKVLYTFRMPFLYEFIKTLRNTDIRFAPGIAGEEVTEPIQEISLQKKKESIDFLLQSMCKQTTLPIVLVYCPNVPRIENNAISYEDPDETLWRMVWESSRKFNQIHCISMKDSFIREYKEKTRLCRGFPNSIPGKGHFNQTGNRLIATRVFQYLMEKKNALLSN